MKSDITANTTEMLNTASGPDTAESFQLAKPAFEPQGGKGQHGMVPIIPRTFVTIQNSKDRPGLVERP